MELAIIVAMSENRCIGRNNRLPWHLPDEWANFHRIADGKPFLMGRKSYESPDGLYSDYRTVVLSHHPNLPLPHQPAELASSLDEALAALAHEDQVLILGGVSIFEELLPKTYRLYLSIIHAHIEGDVFFPEVNFLEWTRVESKHHAADDRHAYPFSMNEYVRTSKV